MSGFEPGDLIYRSRPFVYVLNDFCNGKRCDYCFAKKNELKRCSRCTFVYYCDRSCQVSAWDTHKLECKYIKKVIEILPDEPPDFELRLLALIILKIKKCGYYEPSEFVHGQKMNLQRLVSHSDDVMKNAKVLSKMSGLLDGLEFYLGDKNIPPRSEFIEIFGKMHVNTFSIYDFEATQHIGSGIYLGGAIFDHSCEPEAEVAYNGVELSVRAIKPIPHTDVTKINICYINQIELLKDRQDYLQEHYFFNCHCSRCSSTFYEDLMTKTLVDKSTVEDQVVKLKKGIDIIKQMLKNGVSSSIIFDACLKELEKQEGVLAETHVLRIRLLEFLYDLCEENQQYEDAFVFGKALTEPYRILYGKYNSSLSFHLYHLGMIQCILGLVESAKSTLLEARENLKVTHGTDHPLYGKLLDLLQKCQTCS